MVSVVGREVVFEPIALPPWYEIEAIEGSVPDDSGVATQPNSDVQSLEEIEPLGVALGFVVAHDREKRDSRFGECLEHFERAQDIDEPWPAVVKEVASVDHGVDVVLDRVVDHPSEGGQKIASSLRRVILPVAEVGIGGVKHPCH